MSIKEISVVIIAKNAQETIQDTLESLREFGEVLLYLNESSDRTKEIAMNYQNVVVIEGAFIGFGPTKDHAATFAKYDWILSLDSDEILTEELVEEINALPFQTRNEIYKLTRDNYFLGHRTQSRDTIVRLYHRGYTHFNENMVHEKIIIPPDAIVHTLKHRFIHLNITNINQTLTKMIQYTDLGAEGKKSCFFGTVIAKSIFAFFKTYILEGNIIRGWVGFALAINFANRRYYKYIKQYINCQNEKGKLSSK